MSYAREGLGAVSGGETAVRSARSVLASMLSQLVALGETSTLKIEASDNETLKGELCGLGFATGPCQSVTKPSPWVGSNVIVWPAADFNRCEAAWATCVAYVGKGGSFALRQTNIAKAIVATRALLAAVDAKLPGASGSVFLLLALAIGGAVAMRKKGRT